MEGPELLQFTLRCRTRSSWKQKSLLFPNQQVAAADRGGDEHYQPYAIPLEGGIPESAFEQRLMAIGPAVLRATRAQPAYLNAESRTEQVRTLCFRQTWEPGTAEAGPARPGQLWMGSMPTIPG
jgi:hypothetical protein